MGSMSHIGSSSNLGSASYLGPSSHMGSASHLGSHRSLDPNTLAVESESHIKKPPIHGKLQPSVFYLE